MSLKNMKKLMFITLIVLAAVGIIYTKLAWSGNTRIARERALRVATIAEVSIQTEDLKQLDAVFRISGRKNIKK